MASELIGDSTLPVPTADAQRVAGGAWSFELIFPVGEARRYCLSSSRRVSIGRDVTADVVIASHQVSRHHADIARVRDELWIHDSGSLNGTHVNAERVARHPLQAGDVVRIGDRLGVIVRDESKARVSVELAEIAQGLWAGPVLRAALASAQQVAQTDLPIVLQGATGTGKERVARAIHEWSGRAGPFVAINCAAIPEHLAEAELFGYKKGAFTGAVNAAIGHLRAAHGGTLLLDEVSDLPLPLQAKLLRVTEQGEVQPLGEARALPLDVRLVVASQRPLALEVEAGRFRADLHARLNGMTVSLPALSQRRREIPSLFVQLLSQRLGAVPPPLEAPLVERLLLYGWPGNVRELDLLARRLLGLHGHERSFCLAHLTGTALEVCEAAELSRDERDVQALLAGLRTSHGNLSQAAALARVSRQRAYRLLQNHAGLDLEAWRKGAIA
ncbi:MAG TPA: sigma 54-interacting transcriptional regulator [Polyangiaceae bacterium]|nr:sigma 54-interacting transcriptional regulator [Polyangiaceae bacterium]